MSAKLEAMNTEWTKSDQHLEASDEFRPRWYIVDSAGLPKKLWDVVMAFTLASISLYVPFKIAFGDDDALEVKDSQYYFEFCLDMVFYVDIPLNFVTSVADEETGRLITNPVKISKMYVMSGWLFVDTFSSLPFDSFLASNTAKVTKILKIVRALKIIKMFRASKMARIMQALQNELELKNSSVLIVKFVSILCLFAHWMGCMFYFAAKLQDFPADSWVNIYLQNQPCPEPDCDSVGPPLNDRSTFSKYLGTTTSTTRCSFVVCWCFCCYYYNYYHGGIILRPLLLL